MLTLGVWITERLLLEEKLSAKLTDEVYAAEGGDDRSTNSPWCIVRNNCLLHTSSVTESLCDSATASPQGEALVIGSLAARFGIPRRVLSDPTDHVG